MARDNVVLGNFQLAGIPPAPRGVPQVEVSFDIDANGILHVTAKDMGTNKQQTIRITAPHKLSKDDIEKKMKEADQFAEEDKTRREEAEAKNEADSLAYTAEKTLEEFKDKIAPDKAEKIKAEATAIREAVAKNAPLPELKAKTESLRKAVQEIGSSIYSQAGAQGEAGAPGGAPNARGGNSENAGGEEGGESKGGKGNGDDNVVDAEFTKSK